MTKSTDQAIFLVKVMRASCAQSYFVGPTTYSPYLNSDQPEKVNPRTGGLGYSRQSSWPPDKGRYRVGEGSYGTLAIDL